MISAMNFHSGFFSVADQAMSATCLRSAEWMRRFPLPFPLMGRLIGNGWFERAFSPVVLGAHQLQQGYRVTNPPIVSTRHSAGYPSGPAC
jgi:hypothetical protein